jgi:hypothetical protein
VIVCKICMSDHTRTYPSKISPFFIERMGIDKSFKTNIVECKSCGFMSFDPLPEERYFDRVYSGYRSGEYQKQRQQYEQMYTKEMNDGLNNDINISQRIEKAFVKGHSYQIVSVLDYGGYRGEHLKNLPIPNKYVYDISNMELSDGIFRAEKGMKFDFIICTHLLEHVCDIYKTMETIVQYAHKGTYFYFEVPAEHWIDTWWKKMASKIYPFHKLHEHINQFTPTSFELLLKRHHIISINVSESNVISYLGLQN